MICLIHGGHDYNIWHTAENRGDCLWVNCMPPDVPEDWHLFVPEPSPEELEVMDLNAVELLAQFI